MLVTSATASNTSSFTSVKSSMRSLDESVQASAALQDKLPVPAQGPVRPISEMMPDAGAEATVCGNGISSDGTSMPNVVENTSSAELTIAATMSALEMVSVSGTLDMALENLHQFLFDLVRVKRFPNVTGGA